MGGGGGGGGGVLRGGGGGGGKYWFQNSQDLETTLSFAKALNIIKFASMKNKN